MTTNFPGRVKWFFCSPKCPDLFRISPVLATNVVPRVPTNFTHLVQRSRIVDLYLHSLIRLQSLRLIKYRDSLYLICTCVNTYCPSALRCIIITHIILLLLLLLTWIIAIIIFKLLFLLILLCSWTSYTYLCDIHLCTLSVTLLFTWLCYCWNRLL
jgi:hypothetical protein